jgi:hypothetical protein
MKIKHYLWTLALVLLVVGGTIVGYKLGGQSISSTSSSSAINNLTSSLHSSLNSSFSSQISSEVSSVTSSEAIVEPAVATVKVFFSKCDIGSPFFDLSPVERVTTRKDVATLTMEEYFKGPTVAEKAQGLCQPVGDAEGVNRCGIAEDFKISIKDGVATYTQCRAVELGDGPGTSRFAEAIGKNISQFNTVSKVRVLDSSGNCLSDLSGLNKCLE